MRTVRYSGRLTGGRGRGTPALLPPVDRILFLTHAFESNLSATSFVDSKYN